MRRSSRGLRRVVGLALLCGVAGSAGALADTPQTWRCEVPNGRFQEAPAATPPGTRSITGRISFHRADYGADWGSSAKVVFMNDTGCRCSGLTVSANRELDSAQFFMLADGKYTPIAQSRFDIPITFHLSLDPDGRMEIRIGRTKPMAVQASVRARHLDRVMMSCSGAEVSFMDIAAD